MALQVRRGTQADLIASNLLLGEPAYAIDTKRFLIGSGDSNPLLVVTQDSGSWTASLYGTDSNNNQYPIGSGTGRWVRVGKTVTLQIMVVANSTTAAGRPVRVSLPPEVNSAHATVLSAHITATGWSSGQAKFPLSATTATGLPIYLHKSNSYLLSEDVAINDRIYITGTYIIP